MYISDFRALYLPNGVMEKQQQQQQTTAHEQLLIMLGNVTET